MLQNKLGKIKQSLKEQKYTITHDIPSTLTFHRYMIKFTIYQKHVQNIIEVINRKKKVQKISFLSDHLRS